MLVAKHPGHINRWSVLCGKIGFSSYYSQVKTERFIQFSISVLHLITSGGQLPSFQFIQMQMPKESRRQWRILPEASSCFILHTEVCWKGFLKSWGTLGFTSKASAAATENICSHFCAWGLWLSLTQYICFLKVILQSRLMCCKGLWFKESRICSPWGSKSIMQTEESQAKPNHGEEGGGESGGGC